MPITKAKFQGYINALLDADTKLVLWGIRYDESDGWGGREAHAIIEDRQSHELMKIRLEFNNMQDNDPLMYFMAETTGWSPLRYVLKSKREKWQKFVENNRRIAGIVD